MNGRAYDPIVGRFLSPDNYIQAPSNTQSFNRYSYAFNNPLKYIDPTGWVGVGVIDGNTITIKATYIYNAGRDGISDKNIEKLKAYVNSYNNSEASKVTKGEYNGYNVKLEFEYVKVINNNYAENIADKKLNDYHYKKLTEYNSLDISNSISVLSNSKFANNDNVQEVAKQHGVSPYNVKGITSDDTQHILLPQSSLNTPSTIFHEMWHTLYFNNDGAVKGVGSPDEGLNEPLNSDTNKLIEGLSREKRLVIKNDNEN